LAVKDVYLIAMAAIKIIGKEHGQWGLAVEDEYFIAMAAIKTLVRSTGNGG
jgi:hypothetical protein